MFEPEGVLAGAGGWGGVAPSIGQSEVQHKQR